VSTSTEIQITSLSDLRPGDRLVARRNGFTHYFGRVDGMAPDSVWIIEGVGGLRRRLPLREYTLWRLTGSASAGSLGYRGAA
jgi:hypothetical protein